MPDHRHHLALCTIALACLLMGTGVRSAGKAPGFPNFRDLKVYTTSEPDAKNPVKIVARTQFVNEGEKAVRIGAKLNPSRALKSTGGTFAKSIPSGKSAEWTWTFTAPAGFTREVLTGSIAINGRRERDLYITVLGQDPEGSYTGGVEPITERARVVATFAPRTQASIRAEMKALEANRLRPVLTLGKSVV